MTTQSDDDGKEYGLGVVARVDEKKGILQINIDLDGDYGFSGSEKNIIIASTSGNQAISYDGGIVKFGLNLFRLPTVAEKTALKKEQLAAEG